MLLRRRRPRLAPSHHHPRYRRPGTYTARLTLTDDEGCSTELIFTGQTAHCNGGSSATATRRVKVEDGLAGLELSLSRRLTRNSLRAKVTCRAADCIAKLRGNVRPGGPRGALRPVVRKSVKLAAGKTTRVKLRIRRRDRPAIRRALRRGRNVKAKLRARAADVFGNVERAKARIRLR